MKAVPSAATAAAAVVENFDRPASSMAASELGDFIEDQKLKATDRIRRCELFLNDPNLPSRALRESLTALRQSAEDDYGTLLHLDRVLNMRGSRLQAGPQPATPPSTPAGASWASGATSLLPPGTRHGHRNPNDDDDDFTVLLGKGGTRPKAHIRAGPLSQEGDKVGDPDPDDDQLFDDGIFDPFGFGDHRRQAVPRSGRSSVSGKTATAAADKSEDEDDDEDLLIDKGRIIERRYAERGGGLQGHGQAAMNLARSLPVSVPLPDNRRLGSRRVGDNDLPPHLDDEDGQPDHNDIPAKIAEIAKSMYDTTYIGELPSPRVQRV